MSLKCSPKASIQDGSSPSPVNPTKLYSSSSDEVKTKSSPSRKRREQALRAKARKSSCDLPIAEQSKGGKSYGKVSSAPRKSSVSTLLAPSEGCGPTAPLRTFTTDELKIAAQQSGSGTRDGTKLFSQMLTSFTPDQLRALIEAKDAYPKKGMGASSAFNSAVSKCTKLKIPRVQITGFMRKYATHVFGDNWNGMRQGE